MILSGFIPNNLQKWSWVTISQDREMLSFLLGHTWKLPAMGHMWHFYTYSILCDVEALYQKRTCNSNLTVHDVTFTFAFTLKSEIWGGWLIDYSTTALRKCHKWSIATSYYPLVCLTGTILLHPMINSMNNHSFSHFSFYKMILRSSTFCSRFNKVFWNLEPGFLILDQYFEM